MMPHEKLLHFRLQFALRIVPIILWAVFVTWLCRKFNSGFAALIFFAVPIWIVSISSLKCPRCGKNLVDRPVSVCFSGKCSMCKANEAEHSPKTSTSKKEPTSRDNHLWYK